MDELIGFIRDPRADVRAVAVGHVLALTGTTDGIASLAPTNIVDELVRVLNEEGDVGVKAAKTLVNLSAHAGFCAALVKSAAFWNATIECVLEGQRSTLDEALMVLSNVTLSKDGSQRFLQGRHDKDAKHLRGHDALRLLDRFVRAPNDDLLQHAASALTNVTQLHEGRALVLDAERAVLPPLLLQLRSGNAVRRRGVAGTVRNCCFSIPDHIRLIEELDIIGHLLLPLLGPEGLQTDDEAGADSTNSLDGLSPILLSALKLGGSELHREPEAAVRRLIVDALLLLAGTRRGREELRSRKTYAVVKVHHLTEEDEKVSEELFKLVDVLLADEAGDGSDEASITEAMGRCSTEEMQSVAAAAQSEKSGATPPPQPAQATRSSAEAAALAKMRTPPPAGALYAVD